MATRTMTCTQKRWKSAALLLPSAFMAVACAAGGFTDRWVFMARAIVDDKDVAFVTNVDAKAASFGFNGMMLAGMDDVGIWPEWRKRGLKVVRRFCEDSGVEPIPMIWSVGYNTMQNRDPSLAEGLEVSSVPYVRCGGKASFDKAAAAEVLCGEGDFENISRKG